MAIFLSYAREDVDLAAFIVEELTELRTDVNIDKEIKGGQDWWDQICDWIQECDIFVLLLSEAWLDSNACRAEAEYAAAMQRPFLPLAIGPVNLDQLPLELKRYQVIQYDPESKESYKQIVKALTNMISSPPAPDPLPERPAIPESYVDPFKRSLASESLTLEDQVSLFAVLKLHSGDPKRHEDAIGLIRELRSRRDLTVGVAEEIDAFLATVEASSAPVAAAAAVATGTDEEHPELPPPPPPMASITLSRPKQAFVGRVGAIHLEVDGERVGGGENGETVELEIPAVPPLRQGVTWFEAIGSRSNELEVVLAPDAHVNLRVRFKSSLKGGLELLEIA